MRTKVYSCYEAKTDTHDWWWCERLPSGGFGPEHGPFETRKEASDAAKAARTTARGNEIS